MIYRNETLKQFKESSRGKLIAVYGNPPKYNVLEMTWKDVSEIIGNIDLTIMGVMEVQRSFTTDPINGISMIPINGKLVPQYPSLTSLFHHCQNDNMVIIPATHHEVRSLYNYTNHPSFVGKYQNVEVHYLLTLINQPEPYELPEPTGPQKIPKIIHYCWFGETPIPPLYQDCIASWRRHCPDYEIMFWNENNTNVKDNPGYAKKEYGFISDALRVDFVYEYGGVYMDCDVELYKSLDRFLHNEIFFSTINNRNICSEVPFGATPKNPLFKQIRHRHNFDGIGYQAFHEVTANWKNEVYYNPEHDLMIYPPDVFHPVNDFAMIESFTNNTHGTHHRGNMWIENRKSKEGQNNLISDRVEIMKFLSSVFGNEVRYINKYKTVYDRL